MNSGQSPELFETFLFDAWEALSSFQQAKDRLMLEHDDEVIKELSVTSHRIKGTAAQYGYAQISHLAELAERLLDGDADIAKSQRDDILMFLEQVSVCLSSALARVSETGQEGEVGLELARLGGSDLVINILRNNPRAFQSVSVEEKDHLAAASVTDTLQHFYRNQQEDWQYFSEEAQGHIDTIERALAQLKKGLSEDGLAELFRATHTLKGAAYMMGLSPIGDLTHSLEDLMVKVREGELPFEESSQEALATGARALSLMLAAAAGKTTSLEQTVASLDTQLANLLGYEEIESRSPLEIALNSFYEGNGDTWEYFEPEVSEHLEASVEALKTLAAAKKPESEQDAINTLFRAMHTVKGAAYMVEFKLLGDVALELEHSVRAVKEEGANISPEFFELFDDGLMLLEQMLRSAEGQATEVDACYQQFRSKLPKTYEQTSQATVKPQTKVDAPVKTIRVSADKLDALMNLANDMIASRSRMATQLERLGELSKLMASGRDRMIKTVGEFEAQYLNPQLSENLGSVTDSQSVASLQRGIGSSLADMFDELEFDTYNDLNILANSINEMANDVHEIQQQLSQLHETSASEANDLERLQMLLRQEIGRARMVPVSQLFNLLKRLLRDTEEKSYALVTQGENVELDNMILEGVADSLVHMVRNALVHGIESKEKRLELGKPEDGQIKLSALLRGNQVILELEDDGAGIDIDAVKQKAVEGGFITAERAAALSHEEACQLIFLSGLSTATEVTTEAGRGVGMDAVAEAIKKLKGDVQMQTRAGVGTRFTLRLPLTLMVSDALMVNVAGQRFGLDTSSVITMRMYPREALTEGLTYEGELLKVHTVRTLLGYYPKKSENATLVIAEAAGERFALEVDALEDIEEVVLRPLGESLSQLYHLSSATTTATGEVVLLLDVAGLIRLSAQDSTLTPLSQAQSVDKQSHQLLLVDDSISVRRVVGRMLERAGYEVTTAADGQAALDLLLEGKTFDAVLTDLEMPRINGYELIEELRRRAETKALPILVMTTRSGEKHRNLALELGANGYFGKPADEVRLLRELRSALTKPVM